MPTIFISYSRKDLAIAEQIATDLKHLGLTVWQAKDFVHSFDDWQLAVEKTIQEVDYVIVLLSPDSKASEWVRRETLFARHLGKAIIPVLVRGDVEKSVPIHLIDLQWIDVSRNYSNAIRALVKTIYSYSPALDTETVVASGIMRAFSKMDRLYYVALLVAAFVGLLVVIALIYLGQTVLQTIVLDEVLEFYYYMLSGLAIGFGLGAAWTILNAYRHFQRQRKAELVNLLYETQQQIDHELESRIDHLLKAH